MPGLSDLLDSDMEEHNFIDENSILSSASDATEAGANLEASKAAKRSKKRRCVTMPKPKARATKASPAPTTKKVTKKPVAAKRKALDEVDEINTVADSQANARSEDESNFETEASHKLKPNGVNKKNGRKGNPLAETGLTEGMEVEHTPMVARSSHAQSAAAKKAPKVIKTTTNKKAQKDSVPDVPTEPSNEALEAEEVDEIAVEQPPMKRARTESRTRQEGPYRRRAGSASDTERGNPNLRRKLGDVTRKFENIDMKYRSLKEVGITEANSNVEKLRKQCEATTEASNNLIASLKKELAQQAPLMQDARKLKKELQTKEEEVARLQASRAELNASLGTAHNEIKALQAKLAAARTTAVELPPAKTPGSAIKAARSVGPMNPEAAQAAQITQMKLDLYGDLTGLIVRSVKRSEDGDTYDCIQTGRNGTLHFKLFIDQEDAKSATFEETEFLYTPLLDANRDRDMIELMPPYLIEDITFARQNAAKFYQRVVDTLTRRANEG